APSYGWPSGIGKQNSCGGMVALPGGPNQPDAARLRTFFAYLFCKTNRASDAETIEVARHYAVAMKIDLAAFRLDESKTFVRRQPDHFPHWQSCALFHWSPHSARVVLQPPAHLVKRLMDRAACIAPFSARLGFFGLPRCLDILQGCVQARIALHNQLFAGHTQIDSDV